MVGGKGGHCLVVCWQTSQWSLVHGLNKEHQWVMWGSLICIDSIGYMLDNQNY